MASSSRNNSIDRTYHNLLLEVNVFRRINFMYAAIMKIIDKPNSTLSSLGMMDGFLTPRQFEQVRNTAFERMPNTYHGVREFPLSTDSKQNMIPILRDEIATYTNSFISKVHEDVIREIDKPPYNKEGIDKKEVHRLIDNASIKYKYLLPTAPTGFSGTSASASSGSRKYSRKNRKSNRKTRRRR